MSGTAGCREARNVGYKHMPWVIDQDGLNASEKMVLTVLTMHANNETRSTWVSMGTICREAGFSPSSRATVRRALDKLRERGLVTWSERFKDNEQTSHLYTVHWTASSEGVGAQNTYPGAQNTYPPVLRTPTPGAQSTTDEEPNQEVLSEEPDWGNDSPPPGADAPSTQASRARSGAEADPIGPHWYNSEARKNLIYQIQTAALEATNDRETAITMFESAVYAALGIDDALIYDMEWYPPAKCKNSYEAAIWLNKFIGWWSNETGEHLTYPPTKETPHA